MATIAVFIALGGGAYAAIKLPSSSVGSKHLKRNAVNSSKVKDRSLLARDFKAGQLPTGAQGAPGPQGPQGAQGQQGPQGEQGRPGTDATPADFAGEPTKPIADPGPAESTCSTIATFCAYNDGVSDQFWANAGPPYKDVGYWKDKGGVVHLEGFATPTDSSVGSVMFILPTGYRPLNRWRAFSVKFCGSTDPAGYIDIRDTGEVVASRTNAGCVPLDGINFRP
jgi:hypothetical protein